VDNGQATVKFGRAVSFPRIIVGMMLSIGSEPLDILLVEDNPGDARLAAEALKEGKLKNRLHIVHDGVEAISFLKRVNGYTASPRPHMIMLDLNLPRKDGREVLAEIKADDELKRIPVIVLTTSQADQDIAKAYGLHANCYITKPVDLDQFISVIRSVEEFWCSLVTLPFR
jgi:chemotaxis family two-component system response regulator Rcp1